MIFNPYPFVLPPKQPWVVEQAVSRLGMVYDMRKVSTEASVSEVHSAVGGRWLLQIFWGQKGLSARFFREIPF